ncbi:unnamed protein product [Strongylus vulgaris]|uniref:Uncharacterized protein n=1 Tax=Strongylus vulgaris TaxID=40348 RepID=A0A3P7IUV3_STRVU|nr:unnamed protein product [Strongylus vulgaris]
MKIGIGGDCPDVLGNSMRQSPWRVVDVSFWSEIYGILYNLTLVLMTSDVGDAIYAGLLFLLHAVQAVK